jgi:hypothetical protein
MNEDPGTERTEIKNDQGAATPGGLNTGLVPEDDQDAAVPPGDAGESFPGFLELFYGVLFEPVKAMKTVAGAPPLGTVTIVVTILVLLGTTMGFLTFSRVLEQSLQAADLEQLLTGVQAMAPFWVVISLLMGYVKWFVYSAVLHLVADLLGGQGNARGVFAVVGLAGLPSALIIPFQFLGYWFGMGNIAVTIILGLASLAVGIWSIVLLVIGVRAVHRLSTGRSVLTVLTPFLALVLFLIILIAAIAVLAISLPYKANFPGYF